MIKNELAMDVIGTLSYKLEQTAQKCRDKGRDPNVPAKEQAIWMLNAGVMTAIALLIDESVEHAIKNQKDTSPPRPDLPRGQ